MQPLTKPYLSDFFFSITEAKTVEDLWNTLLRFFDDYDLRHQRVSIYDAGDAIGPDSFLYMRQNPDGEGSWGQHYLKSGFYKHDKSFRLLFQLGVEVLEWSRMQELTRKGSEGNRVFVEMLDFGIGDGLLVGKSCNLCNHTILTGLAGPTKSFKILRKNHWRSLLYCLRAWNGCMLELSIKEDLLDPSGKPPVYSFSERDVEVLQELSYGLNAQQSGDNLGITKNAIDTVIRRLKNVREIPTNGTRDGIVAYALRTDQIQ